MENIQFRIHLKPIDVNVKSHDVFDAAEEIKQSIEAGDIRVNGIPIKRKDILGIEDIPG